MNDKTITVYNAANTLLDQLKADQGTIWKDESNYQIIK